MEEMTMRVGDRISLQNQETGEQVEALILDMFALEQEERVFLVMTTDNMDVVEAGAEVEVFFLEFDPENKRLVGIESEDDVEQIAAIYEAIVEAEEKAQGEK